MTAEQWRAVVGYEGMYSVSNKGRVRSLERVVTKRTGHTRTVPPRILALRRSGPGWSPTVQLWKHGVGTHHSVRRLMAAAFGTVHGREQFEDRRTA